MIEKRSGSVVQVKLIKRSFQLRWHWLSRKLSSYIHRPFHRVASKNKLVMIQLVHRVHHRVYHVHLVHRLADSPAFDFSWRTLVTGKRMDIDTNEKFLSMHFIFFFLSFLLFSSPPPYRFIHLNGSSCRIFFWLYRSTYAPCYRPTIPNCYICPKPIRKTCCCLKWYDCCGNPMFKSCP